jgi:hypothetical protein
VGAEVDQLAKSVLVKAGAIGLVGEIQQEPQGRPADRGRLLGAGVQEDVAEQLTVWSRVGLQLAETSSADVVAHHLAGNWPGGLGEVLSVVDGVGDRRAEPGGDDPPFRVGASKDRLVPASAGAMSPIAAIVVA